MATIGSDRMIVRAECRQDRSWLFLVCYTARFADAELGERFEDRVLVRPVHSVDQRGYRYESPVAFTACSPQVFRRKRIVVHADCCDAHGELDSVCGWIRLQRAGAESPAAASAEDEARCTPPLVPVTGAPVRPYATGRCRVPAAALRC